MSTYMYHIWIFFFDSIFDSMGNQVSFSNCFLSINQEMELYNAIKSTFSNKTEIDMFDHTMLINEIDDRCFHIWIIAFIEELSDSWSTNVIYIVTHTYRSK